MILRAYCVFLALFLAWPVSASPLFESDQILEIELVGPLTTLVRSMQKEDHQPQPFVLRSAGVEYDIQLSARGKSRLDLCEFPPLRIRFPDGPATHGPFEGIKKLKLVSHCREVLNMQKNVMEEYAAYRMFDLMSDISFRTRLLRITYVDTENGRLNAVGTGFAIEPTSHLAARVGGVEAEIPGVSLQRLDKQQLAMVYVFQYMVGNTDWSLVTSWGSDSCCQNGKLIKREDQLFYVPYDFDLTGLVDAHYASPHSSLRIRRVTQRLYRGFCMEPEPVLEAVRTTVANRQGVMDVIASLPVLEDKDRKKAVKFMDKYFELAANESKIMRIFERSCLDPD